MCEIKHEHSPYRKKKVVPKQNKREEFQIIGYDNLHYLIQYASESSKIFFVNVSVKLYEKQILLVLRNQETTPPPKKKKNTALYVVYCSSLR